jgi:hypothetical protein
MKTHPACIVVAFAALCACSSSSTAPDKVRVASASAAGSTAPPTTVTTGGNGSPGIAASAADAGTLDPKDLARRAGSIGYRVETASSGRRYCRNVTAINSHIPHKECIGESEMITELNSNADTNAQRVMLPHGPCVAKTSC